MTGTRKSQVLDSLPDWPFAGKEPYLDIDAIISLQMYKIIPLKKLVSEPAVASKSIIAEFSQG